MIIFFMKEEKVYNCILFDSITNLQYNIIYTLRVIKTQILNILNS